jgi:hypothetical protein
MFISNDEKKYLFDQIKALSREQSSALSDIIVLKAKIKLLEAKPATVVKPKKPTTIAQKAKQREYMRRYKAKKAAEKLALEQK